MNQSAVTRWENLEKAVKGRDYGPSTNVLVRFARLLANQPGNKYDNKCIWLLVMAGFLKPAPEDSDDAIRCVLDRERSQRTAREPADPGEIVKVPLIEVNTEGPVWGGDPAEVKATWDVPAWLVPDPASIICARPTWGLFPFGSGDVLVIYRWADDPWELVEQGSLVVVHFTRYPAQIEANLSQGEIQRMLERSTKVDLVWRNGIPSIASSLEHHGSPEARKAHDIQPARESELAKRWTPDDERGTVLLEQIQAGWLRLELANYPDFSVHLPRADWPKPDGGPWRLVLQEASVAGVTRGRGLAVPLTVWANSDWQARPLVPLMDSRILGRVISWMSQAPAHEAAPIGTKSRREPK